MKNYLKQLGGYALYALGHRLLNKADSLETQARDLRNRGSLAISMGHRLLGSAIDVFIRPEYFEDDELDDDEEDDEEDNSEAVH